VLLCSLRIASRNFTEEKIIPFISGNMFCQRTMPHYSALPFERQLQGSPQCDNLGKVNQDKDSV
jgi:hypothetical protein